jgi:hypothetical protein
VKTITDVKELVLQYRNLVTGVILYDPDWSTGVISTSLVATTAAGVENAIAVRKDTSVGSMYNWLVNDVDGLKLPVLIDLTGKFTGSGTIWQTSTASTGSKKCDAYIWAKEKYIDTGRCNPTVLMYTLDLWGLKPSMGERTQLSNLDYAISTKGFCFELSPWGDEKPNDDSSQPLGTDLNTFKAILNACNIQNNYSKMIKFCGFTNWDLKYTTDAGGGSHEPDTTEWETVRLCSAYNSYLEADAPGYTDVANCSLYAGLLPKLTARRYIQNPPPSYIDLVSRGFIMAEDQGQVAPKHYILMNQGNFDAVSWVLDWFGVDQYNQSSRGQIPCTFMINPQLMDRTSVAMDYFYRHKTSKDYFVACDSGAGYVYPSQLYGTRSPSGYSSIIPVWQKHCKDYYRILDYSITGYILNVDYQFTSTDASNYAPFSGDGMTAYPLSDLNPALVNNVPVINYQRDIYTYDDVNNAALIASDYSSGVVFHSYHIGDIGPDHVKGITDRLGSNHCPLDAYTFYYLLRYYLGGSNDYRATWVGDTIPRVMKAGQSYAVTVTARNDGWDTWSEASMYRLGHAFVAPGVTPTTDDYDAYGRAYIPGGASIGTGQNVTFSFNMTAPATPGTYDLYYSMLKENVTWFQSQNNIEWKMQIVVANNETDVDTDNDGWPDVTEISSGMLYWNPDDAIPETIGWWKFDDGVGANPVDSSGNGFIGSLQGAPVWTKDGKINGALQFDGADDYVLVPIDVSETSYAVSLWFKTSSANCGIYQVYNAADGGHDRMVYLSSGNVYAQVYSNEWIHSTGTNYADGKWHCIVHTFGGPAGGQKLYVDGVLKASGTLTASSFTWQTSICIGYSLGAGSAYFNGLIDDVRVFNDPLNAKQVQRLYQSGPLVWYKFDTGSGNTAVDSSGNGYDGTIIGAGWVNGKLGKALEFDGVDYVTVPTASCSSLSKEMSVSLWQYGNAAIQPQDDFAFDSADAEGNKLFSAHIPWSDGIVYWDAGNTVGSYDRISKAANPSDYEGQWNHWVFTKNADTGVMKIYLNGKLWHSGIGKTRTIGTVSVFKIGARSTYGDYNYDGLIDDFRLYSRELTANEVSEIYNYGLLIGRWTFDDATGQVAKDTSENGNNGTINGPAWVDGESGDALDFDGTNDYITLPATAFSTLNKECTLSFWQFGDTVAQPQTNNAMIFEARDALNYRVLGSHLPTGDELVYWFAGNSGTASYDEFASLSTASDYKGKWNHWVFIKNANTGYMKIYVNGNLWRTASGLTRTMGGITNFRIGSPVAGNWFYDGSIDDFRVYDRELSAEDVGGIYACSLPTNAKSPHPAIAAVDVNVQADLTWTTGSGGGAITQDVYFGTNRTNVANATHASGEFKGNQADTTYDTGTLTANTTYYWRIDEVRDDGITGTTKGMVWHFTTAAAPGQATIPSPANSATGVSLTPTLTWTASSGTTSHNVYFGTDSTPDETEYKGNQAGTTYAPSTLTNNTTYYWRIDEVGPGGTTTGTVWSFTTIKAVPTFVAVGSVASGTGTITPALPTGRATDDILLLFLETANQAISITNQNGGTWTQVTNSPQGTGTAGGTTATRLTVFWSRYNGTQGAPTTSDSGDHQLGRIIAIRGAATSGNPWDVTAGGVEATSDTSGSIPGATTTVGNTLVVTAIATSLPDSTSTTRFSAWINANLTSVTERTDNSVTAGNGGGLGVATGIKATAGAYGNTAVTLATSASKGMMSIAIKP